MKLISTLILSSLVLGAEPTPIERRIADARQSIEKNKKNAGAYNELAMALVRRARETANPSFCVDAEAPVAESLKIEPGNFMGRRAHVAVRLCQMRWADALEEATALHNQVMDDVPTWGYIADAQTALGNYEAAAKAAQWMLDMRPANPQGLQRAAALREAYGYNGPAMEWWTSALRVTSSTDVEERAWILTRIAKLSRTVGKNDEAEASVRQALSLEPDYPWALIELGHIQMQRKKFAEAFTAFQSRQRVAPSVAGLYNLACALSAAGQTEQAQLTYAEFEKRALPLTTNPDNANIELIAYYSGTGNKPAEAARIAQETLARRHDLDTLAAYAQALAAQGEWKAAAGQMTQALKTGVKNPVWFLDAARIARKAGDEAAARKYFQQALEAAPSSSISEQVMQELLKTGT